MTQALTDRPAPARTVPRWVQPAVLALPFVVTFLVTDHLRRTVVSFHYTDEVVYHLPVIREFAASWPAAHLGDYDSATGPLYHYLMATAAQLVGTDPWPLRTLTMIISWASVCVVAAILREVGAPFALQTVGALVLALSPFVFGTGFVLLTDPLAMLAVAVAVLAALGPAGRRGRGATGLVALALATVTRQTTVWLAVPLLLRGGGEGRTARRLATRAAGIAVALLPLAGLALLWRGLTPPALQGFHDSGYHPRNLVLALAVLGLYSVIAAPLLRDRWPAHRTGGLVGAAIGLALPLLVPTVAREGDDGWLWMVSRQVPVTVSSNLVFLLLCTLGGLALGLVADRSTAPALLTLGAFALTLGANATNYQKYSDPFVLVAVLLYVGSRWPQRPGARRWIWLVLAVVVLGSLGDIARQNL